MSLDENGPTYPVADSHRNGKRRGRIWIIIAVVALAVLVGGAFTARYLIHDLNASPGARGMFRLNIRQGMTAAQVADTLEAAELIKSADFFLAAARMSDFDRQIHAGTHWVDGSRTTYEILQSLMRGGLSVVRVTVPEGHTIHGVAGVLARHLPFSAEQFDSLANTDEMLRRYGLPGTTTLEGQLFPDTYYFDGLSTPEDAIRVMTRKLKQVFIPEWRVRADSINMSIQNVLTLASIVEKEAMVDRERPIISQVFHKRLRIGYRLEADPTVKYVMERSRRRLSLRDIEVESPYNTYRNHGLPPGPICSPGARSIEATLWPSVETNYLYFVANWDGTHTFSRTLVEHNRAKVISNRRYWRMRAEQRRRAAERQASTG